MAFTTAVKSQEVQRALDGALQSTRYSCKLVSWDDVCRAQDPFSTSVQSVGPNITDTYLRAANGASLYTVRSDNWNEKLGLVNARDIALLTGNCDGLRDGSLATISLDMFLACPHENGGRYVGLNGNLHNPILDTEVSIRFQTVFLPLETGDGRNSNSIQFASEAYNYQTSSEVDPRNIILLATTQGLSVQAGERGRKRLYLHHGEPGSSRAYWMKAEASCHRVGTQQKDTPAERADALARGDATSECLGISAMGERFNALMTIQVPLRQWNTFGSRQPSLFGNQNTAFGASGDLFGSSGGAFDAAPLPQSQANANLFGGGAAPPHGNGLGGGASAFGSGSGFVYHAPPQLGRASAARLSRGDYAGMVPSLAFNRPAVRHPDEHITVTVVLYHAVKDGVPSTGDALAAVEELERLYSACNTSGNLAESKFNAVKSGPSLFAPPPPPPPPQTFKFAIPRSSMNAGDVVMQKIGEFEGAQHAKFLEMKLMTLGAVEDGMARAMIASKLDAIRTKIVHEKKAKQAMMEELKLLIQGALNK